MYLYQIVMYSTFAETSSGIACFVHVHLGLLSGPSSGFIAAFLAAVLPTHLEQCLMQGVLEALPINHSLEGSVLGSSTTVAFLTPWTIQCCWCKCFDS